MISNLGSSGSFFSKKKKKGPQRLSLVKMFKKKGHKGKKSAHNTKKGQEAHNTC